MKNYDKELVFCRADKVCVGAALVFVAVYRLLLIFSYSAKYIDEDQALMWWGTVLAAHFDLKEPHFLGQAYGSMLESIAAVPFYWIGVPLNIALPLATSLIWFLPFLICAWISLRNGKTKESVVIILISLLNRWDYDVLTTIPRSFISGFVFSFMGIMALIIGLNDNDKRIIFLGPIFFSIGYIATETTITVIGLACLYFLLYQYRSLVKNYRSLLLGMALGCLLVKYCNRLFYETNTEYAMHGGIGGKVSLSSSVFKENLTMNAAKLLNTFSLINISTIPIVLIVLIVGIIFVIVSRRDWRMAIIFGCMIAGSVIVMSLPRTLNFYDNLFFSQARMFLFLPYLIIECILFLEESGGDYNIELRGRHTIIALTVIVGYMAIIKGIGFVHFTLEDDTLYKPAVVGGAETSQIYAGAKQIAYKAAKLRCNVVVMESDNRALGYATGAINYGRYLSYNACYDRRTDIYMRLKQSYIDENVLFVKTDGNIISEMYAERVTGNLISYLRNEKLIQRYPKSSKFYID